MKRFKIFVDNATRPELEALAKGANTSLRHLAFLYSGARNASADLAARIESASASIARYSKGRLQRLSRADISPACAACPYAAKFKRVPTGKEKK